MDTYTLTEIRKAQDVNTPWGDSVELAGKISVADGRWIKRRPLPGTEEEIIWIPFGEMLFIDRIYDPAPSHQAASSKWYHVYTLNGEVGWVSGGVNVLPDGKYKGPIALEPDCELYQVQKGDNLWQISHKHYRTSGQWGNDTRFYVGALAYVNKYTDGIIVPSNLNFRDNEAWEKLSLIREGTALWIPRKEFLLPLKERVVSSGSWYFDTAHYIIRVAKKIYNWAVQGVGIIAGLLKGALLSVLDIFEDAVGLLKILMKTVSAIITRKILPFAKKIYDAISSIISNAGKILKELLQDFSSKWNHEDPWQRGLFRGTVIGYLIGFAIITYLTAGGAALVKAMSKSTRFAKIGAEVAKGLQKIPEVLKIADSFPQEALAIAGDAGKHFKHKIGFNTEAPRAVRHVSSPMESRALSDTSATPANRMTSAAKTESPLGILEGAGLNKKQVLMLRTFLGRFPKAFQDVWDGVLNDNTRKKLSEVKQLIVKGDLAEARKVARKMYDNYRRRFWGAVYADDGLNELIKGMGAQLPKRGNTPYFILPNGKKEYITLDHKMRILDDPSIAVDSGNFQFSLGRENSVLLEFIRNDPNFKNFSEKLNIGIDE